MILIADVNTLWRRKPFEALAKTLPVIGLAPQDVLLAWRGRHAGNIANKAASFFHECPCLMPPGWASRFPKWSARRLWSVAGKTVQTLKDEISELVVTSPHYLPLIRLARQSVPTFYYCSDDYAQYAGWGGSDMLRLEAEVVREATHSFFVSTVLAERALKNYDVPAAKVSVSANATSDDFLEPVVEEDLRALLARHPQLRRPLVGVVGGINDRLDFELLLKCASLREVGSLVMVGPVAVNLDDKAFAQLRQHPRCVFMGAQPHADLRVWMQALDVALIPYRESRFNQACSPMRLFDHLAAGRSIVATSACAQVEEFANAVRIGRSADEVLSCLAEECQRKPDAMEIEMRRALAKKNTWAVRAENLKQMLQPATTGNF